MNDQNTNDVSWQPEEVPAPPVLPDPVEPPPPPSEPEWVDPAPLPGEPEPVQPPVPPSEPESTQPQVPPSEPESAPPAAEVISPAYAPPPPPPPSGNQYAPPSPAAPARGGAAEKSKVVAGVLGILLGGLGIHKFYLGYTNEGIIMLAGNLLWIIGLGWVPNLVGLIEGLIYLFKSDQDFYDTYVVGTKKWF